MDIYKLTENISCTIIKVRFTSYSDIKFDGWIGAHIRNRLLYFMESVPYEYGLSTRQFLTDNPLEDSHPLYKELSGGAPKGYSLKIESPIIYDQNYEIKTNRSIIFSISLVGVLSKATNNTIEAIRLLAKQGLNKISFKCDILNVETIFLSNLSAMFMSNKVIGLSFLTPTQLYKTKNRDSRNSFQIKLNGLPSLCQIVQSSANRVAKLAAFYSGAEWNDELIKSVEDIVDNSVGLEIKSCNIDNMSLVTAPRVSDKRRMHFRGIVGKMSWQGEDANVLLPLLKFSSLLNIGNDTVYGMGSIEVDDFNN